MKPEEALQRAVADFLAVALPEGVAWTAFPAGGGGRIRGAVLKAMGLRAGWPDLQVVWKGRYIGIELKPGVGHRRDLTKAQRDRHKEIVLAGGVVTTCRSVEAVEGFLRGVGVPLRATTGGPSDTF